MIVPSFIAPFGGREALKKEMEQDPSRMGKRGVGGGGEGGGRVEAARKEVWGGGRWMGVCY